MKKLASVAAAAVMVLSGCGAADETYRPENYVDSSKTAVSHAPLSTANVSTSSAASPVRSSSAAQSLPETSSAIEFPYEIGDTLLELRTTQSDKNGMLSFTVENVISDGRYYTVTLSGTKTDSEDSGTILVNDEYYGSVKLTLSKNGILLDSMELNPLSGERILALEGAASNLAYGCEALSSIRDFGAAEYPDFLELTFRGRSTEAAVPEYARFFTVFDGKLAELPVYENGVKAEPRGAMLTLRGAGLAAQYLTVLKAGMTDKYEIIKYEYRFDLENRRLNKQQVRFYGFDY